MRFAAPSTLSFCKPDRTKEVTARIALKERYASSYRNGKGRGKDVLFTCSCVVKRQTYGIGGDEDIVSRMRNVWDCIKAKTCNITGQDLRDLLYSCASALLYLSKVLFVNDADLKQ